MKKRILLIVLISLLSWSSFAKGKPSDDKIEFVGLVNMDPFESSYYQICKNQYNKDQALFKQCALKEQKIFLFEKPSENSKPFGYIKIIPLKGENYTHLYQWVKTDGSIIGFEVDSKKDCKFKEKCGYDYSYIECIANWYKIPPNPFPKSLWLKNDKFSCSGGKGRKEILLKKDIVVTDIGTNKKVKIPEGTYMFIIKIKDGKIYLTKDIPYPYFIDNNDTEVLKKLKEYPNSNNLKGKKLDKLLENIKERVLKDKVKAYDDYIATIKYFVEIKDFLDKDLHLPYVQDRRGD